MKKKRKRSSEEIHAELMRTDENYRRMAELIESRRTDEERAAVPLGSEAFSREPWRQVEERIAYYEARRREAS